MVRFVGWLIRTLVTLDSVISPYLPHYLLPTTIPFPHPTLPTPSTLPPAACPRISPYRRFLACLPIALPFTVPCILLPALPAAARARAATRVVVGGRKNMACSPAPVCNLPSYYSSLSLSFSSLCPCPIFFFFLTLPKPLGPPPCRILPTPSLCPTCVCIAFL